MQNRFYMKDEVSFRDFPMYAEKPRRGSRVLKVFLVLLLLLAAIVAGLYFLGTSRRSDSGTAVAPTASPVPTETPSASVSGTLTPSPSGTLERSELSVAVLNGSGIRGVANITAATLRDAGYAVGATGNAARFDYAGVTILVKEAESRYADLLKEDLNAPNATVTTDDTIATDAVVIVGR